MLSDEVNEMKESMDGAEGRAARWPLDHSCRIGVAVVVVACRRGCRRLRRSPLGSLLHHSHVSCLSGAANAERALAKLLCENDGAGITARDGRWRLRTRAPATPKTETTSDFWFTGKGSVGRSAGREDG